MVDDAAGEAAIAHCERGLEKRRYLGVGGKASDRFISLVCHILIRDPCKSARGRMLANSLV
jgi:hypothetical protein